MRGIFLEMNILFYGLLLFFLSWVIHFIIWRIQLPKTNHTVILLVLFSAVFIIFGGIVTGCNFYAYLQLALLYFSLVFAYLVSYSAIEVDSPSLVIMLTVVKAQSGFKKEELDKIMDNDSLILPMMKRLFDDRMIYLDNSKYRLTAKGRFLISIFVLFRKLLNAPKGG